MAYLGSPESLHGQLLGFWGPTGQQSYETFIYLILVLGVTMDQSFQQDLHFLLGLFRFRLCQKFCYGSHTWAKKRKYEVGQDLGKQFPLKVA